MNAPSTIAPQQWQPEIDNKAFRPRKRSRNKLHTALQLRRATAAAPRAGNTQPPRRPASPACLNRLTPTALTGVHATGLGLTGDRKTTWGARLSLLDASHSTFRFLVPETTGAVWPSGACSSPFSVRFQDRWPTNECVFRDIFLSLNRSGLLRTTHGSTVFMPISSTCYLDPRSYRNCNSAQFLMPRYSLKKSNLR